jgi:hypothetical protein
MYDYYYNQWGQFDSGSSNISSCIYNGVQAILDDSNNIFVETTDVFSDGSTPVAMSFDTGWFNLTGLQGFERAYFFTFLGEFFSAHSLTFDIYFDYDETSAQTITIDPTTSTVEQWRLFFNKQKCQAFKIRMQEVVTTAGRGLSISGINLVVGIKGTYARINASNSKG